MNRTACRKRALKRQKQLEATHARPAAHPVLAGLHLPEDSSGRAARLVLLGSSRALVENCRGVEEIGETRIRLRLGEGVLTIEVENLRLSDVCADAACVCGRVRALRLPGAEDGHD